MKMNNLDKKYTDLLQDILENGTRKMDRTGTGTLSVFGRQIRHKMSDGFPLLTTKKMAWKTMVTELLWFLRGDTNIKFLVDNNCHIWDGDAYKNYVKHWEPMIEYIDNKPILTQEDFINKIKTDDEFAYKWGDLGPVYGAQWRSWHWRSEPFLPEEKDMIYTTDDKPVTWSREKYIDQIANLINDLKTNPDSRRMMVNAWNVAELDQMVLPPCHYGFQIYTRELSLDEKIDLLLEKKDWDDYDTLSFKEKIEKGPQRAISLMWNQRSVDTFLGLPFNIASYGLLLEIIAKAVNMVPDELIGNLGDTHLYSDHIEQAKEQIGRELSESERYIMFEDKGYEFRMNDWSREEQFDKAGIPKRTREPYPLPKLIICGDMRRTDGFTVPFDELDYSLIKLIDYQSHSSIKAPLSN